MFWTTAKGSQYLLKLLYDILSQVGQKEQGEPQTNVNQFEAQIESADMPKILSSSKRAIYKKRSTSLKPKRLALARNFSLQVGHSSLFP